MSKKMYHSKKLENNIFPPFAHFICVLSISAHSPSSLPYGIIERREKMSLLETVYLSNYPLQSSLCKSYILSYEIFNNHNADTFPSGNFHFTKQIFLQLCPLLPNGYPGAMLLALRFNPIFSTNSSVEANEIRQKQTLFSDF